MANLEERQRQRYLVLSKLYELTDGAPVRRVEADAVREATGLTEVTFHDAVQYLRGEGLLKISNLVLELTHQGIVEYERSLEKPDAPTEHFPVQVIQQFNAPVGTVQTGAHATANVVQNIGSSAGEILELLARLRRDIEATLPAEERVEALELVEGIDEEAPALRTHQSVPERARELRARPPQTLWRRRLHSSSVYRHTKANLS
jgi:hypothetical protein